MFRLRLTVCAVVGLFLFSMIGAGPVPMQRAAAGIGTTVYLPNVTKKLGGEDGWQRRSSCRTSEAIPRM